MQQSPRGLAPCGRAHLLASLAVFATWLAALLTFALAHAAATCRTAARLPPLLAPLAPLPTTFAVVLAAVALGAVAAGVVADRYGRAATLRLLFAVSSLACAGALATHPDDGLILLALAAATGAAAGGAHVAATLLLELVRRRHRAFALLAFPALFFPVGLAQRGLEKAGWGRAVAATLAACCAAGAGLLWLPESPAFLQAKAASLAIEAQRRAASAPLPFGDYDDEAERALSLALSGAALPLPVVEDSVPRGFGLRDEVPTPQALRRRALQRCCRCCADLERGASLTATLWLLLTPVVYLVALTCFRVSAPDGDSAASRLCKARIEGPLDLVFNGNSSVAGLSPVPSPLPVPAAWPSPSPLPALLTPLDPIYVGNASAAGACAAQTQAPGSSPAALALFTSGLHLVLAELVALVAVALLINCRALGRRATLSATFGAASLSLVLAAAASPGFGCSATWQRAVVEALARFTLSACAQTLFVYTIELGSTGVRSSAVGTCVALFRLGALLTLTGAPGFPDGEQAASAEVGANAEVPQLQWTLYALQREYGLLFGLTPESAAHTAAASAVLAVSAQACFICACLAACLPQDTRSKLLLGPATVVPGAAPAWDAMSSSTLAPAAKPHQRRRDAEGLAEAGAFSSATSAALDYDTEVADNDKDGEADGEDADERSVREDCTRVLTRLLGRRPMAAAVSAVTRASWRPAAVSAPRNRYALISRAAPPERDGLERLGSLSSHQRAVAEAEGEVEGESGDADEHEAAAMLPAPAKLSPFFSRVFAMHPKTRRTRALSTGHRGGRAGLHVTVADSAVGAAAGAPASLSVEDLLPARVVDAESLGEFVAEVEERGVASEALSCVILLEALAEALSEGPNSLPLDTSELDVARLLEEAQRLRMLASMWRYA